MRCTISKGVGLVLGLAGTSGLYFYRRTHNRVHNELYPALRSADALIKQAQRTETERAEASGPTDHVDVGSKRKVNNHVEQGRSQ